VLDDFSQTSADGDEESVEVQMRDDGIVHLQQQSLSVTLLCQLLLGGLSAFVVQHIVDGDCDLLGDLLHEGDLGFLIDFLLHAPESHGAEPALGRRQRHHTEGLHPVLAKQRHEFGKPVFLGHIIDHQRLLSSPH
jgi:hypothetical protein